MSVWLRTKQKISPLPQQTQIAAQAGRRGVDPYGVATNLSTCKPILGVRYMRPRWRNFAKAKPPPFVVKRREAGRSWRERPSSLSFALSLWNDKERASSRYSERPFRQGEIWKFRSPAKHGRHASMNTKLRAKLCEADYEGVKSLAKLPLPPH